MDFNFEEEETPEQRKGPKKRFRKNKLKLVFDSEERKKFLQGFRKRKQERKEKYIEKLERDLEKEKRKIRQQTQRATKKLSSSHSVLPEVQSLIDMPEKTETYDLGNTLVSITSLDDQVHRNISIIKEENSDSESFKVDLKKRNKRTKMDMSLGSDDEDGLNEAVKHDPFFNPINDDEFSRSDLSSEEEEQIDYNPLEMVRKQTGANELKPGEKPVSKAKLEREANRMLQQSEVFKKMQKIKQKRSKKFRMFRLQPAETKDGTSDKKSSEVQRGGGGKKSRTVQTKRKRGSRK